MKNKKYIASVFVSVILALLATQGVLYTVKAGAAKPQTESIAIQSVGDTIATDGTIHSSNEATLHFQTAGKLSYLPVKEGDSVYQGQTIAQLDTYALQRQLTQALNTYQSNRDTFDQTQQNAQNNVLQTQQSLPGVQTDRNSAINDAVKRLLDQNQTTLSNSVLNVELANYALQLSTITAPFNGVITHEDVTSANQNVTALTSFSLADPNALVFKANVAAKDTDFVQVGAPATITLTGNNTQISGTVVKMYPTKVTLATGQDVYQVDIQADALKGVTKFGQAGTALIKTSVQDATVLVPTWTIIGHNYVWVMQGSTPVMKQVTVGTTHGEQTEIRSGLSQNDRIIVSPSSIAAKEYNAL